jgi:hypothetical protein
MAFARIACCACVAAAALLAGGTAVAQAGTRTNKILVLSPNGRVHAHATTGATAAEARPPRRAVRRAQAARK